MPTSLLELIDPHGPEYRQGQEAYSAGLDYSACPYPRRRGVRHIDLQRFNWFSGYWAARATAEQRNNRVRVASLKDEITSESLP